jgi:dTDP-glucose 4,6-dehydratase
MNLVVTGGAGFIGSNFVRYVLTNHSEKIKRIYIVDSLTYSGNLDNCSDFLSDGRVEFIHADIRDSNAIKNVMRASQAVVNFAAESHVDRSIEDSSVFLETNLLGLQNLLELAKKYDFQKFVQVSTDEVYGSILNTSASEEHQLLPNSPYAASKAAGDLLARSYWITHGVNVTITRSSNNFGRNQHPEKLIPKIITRLIDGQRVPIFGNGMNIRDWISVEDNCEALTAVLFYGKPGEIYNIGGGNEFTNLDILGMIINALGLQGPADLYFDFIEDRKGHDFRYSVDSSKITKHLGFLPKHAFEDEIKKTVKWYEDNKDWWASIV